MSDTSFSPTILVAEDCNNYRMFICELIRCSDLNSPTIIEAKDGNECYTIISTNNNIDLVILDIDMPGYTGIEILEFAKSREYELKFIMCSSRSRAEVIDETFSLGAIDYVMKPFEEDKLIKAIKDNLDIDQ